MLFIMCEFKLIHAVTSSSCWHIVGLAIHTQSCAVQVLIPSQYLSLQTSSTHHPRAPTTLSGSTHRERNTPPPTPWGPGPATESGTPRPRPTPTHSPPSLAAACRTSRPPVPTPWPDGPSLGVSQRTWPSHPALDATTPLR